MRKNSLIPPDKFIETWQKSKTLDEVLETLNISYSCAKSRAATFQKRFGIPLKKFPRKKWSKFNSEDIDRLVKLAKKSLRESEEADSPEE